MSSATGVDLPFDAEDERWQLALRIAASGSLGRSGLLPDFLLHIVDRLICGRTDEITEQRIGVAVFGRAPDYDPNEDNIVRSYARKLRKRIEEYFATEGRQEILRLEIPRGGYTPVFSEHPQAFCEAQAAVLPVAMEPAAVRDEESALRALAARPAAKSTSRWSDADAALMRGWTIAVIATVVTLLLGVTAALLHSPRPHFTEEEATSHLLWRQLFSTSRDTFIVPSDAGLVIMQRLVERPVPLTTYVNGDYRAHLKTAASPDVDELLKLSARRYTSVADLEFATRLAQLKEVVPGRMLVRYARDLRMDDLRTGNAILLGSDEANPWIELFRPELHFPFHLDPDKNKPSGFLNLYPRQGEATLYTTKGQPEQTYGIIAYLPNLSDTGHVLIVAGLNTAGTQAAAAFLLNRSAMLPILQHARTPSGDLQPFQVLVGAGNVAANASTPHIVLERTGLPAERPAQK